MNLLELLAAGHVEQFNAQRGQRRRLELFASDLAKAKICGVDLSNAILEKSDLTDADLSEANLSKADLSGIDANDLNLSDATAVGARWREAILENADLSRADLSHGDFADAVLTGSLGTEVKFHGARLRGVNATGVRWPRAELVEARLHQADFTSASLVNADLTEATANEAKFEGADLSSMIGIRIKLQQAVLKSANLRAARLEEAQFQSADLTEARLEGADLRKANFTGANLTKTNLRGANLTEAVLDGVDLSTADLTDADLSGIDVRHLGLSDAQIASLAASGVVVAPEAPLRFSEVSAAVNDTAIAVFWENPDSEQVLTLRYAISTSEGSVHGALPVAADGVLSRAIIPQAEGFLLIVLQERAGGAAVIRYSLTPQGELSAPKVEPLGYEPAVQPVFRVVDGVPMAWGLSRRGPMLVIQRLGENLEMIGGSKLPTARGFIPGHEPVLACKGGVLVLADAQGAREPFRTPTDFPTPNSAVACSSDRVFGVWHETRRGRDEPGGVRGAWMGPKLQPKTLTLSTGDELVALDAVGDEQGVWVAWSTLGGAAGDGVFVARLTNEGEPEISKLKLPNGMEVEELRFVLGEQLLLSLVTTKEDLWIVEFDGTLRASWSAGMVSGA